MIRIKVTKDYKTFKAGEIHEVTKNVAFDLIDRGCAVVSKEMQERDMQTKTVKVKKRG